MLTFRDITQKDHDLILPMVEDFYHSDAVLHPVDPAVLERSFQAAADHGEDLLRGVLISADEQPAGYLYITQCYSAEVGADVSFWRKSTSSPSSGAKVWGSDSILD